MKIEYNNTDGYVVTSKWGPVVYCKSYLEAERYLEQRRKMYAILDGDGNVDKVFSNMHEARLDGRQIVELSGITDDILEQDESELEDMDYDNEI